ncbi:MAG: hypothetical protein HYW49_09695 [Deltaproteobacteria bacterium]|nr:hypothetical protein [Deltaproteobacteria bacterium]
MVRYSINRYFHALFVCTLMLSAGNAVAQQAGESPKVGTDISGLTFQYNVSRNPQHYPDVLKFGGTKHSITHHKNGLGTSNIINYSNDRGSIDLGKNWGIDTKGTMGGGLMLVEGNFGPYLGLKSNSGFSIHKHQYPSFNIIDPELELGLAVTSGKAFNLLVAPSYGLSIGQADDANFGFGRKRGAQAIMGINDIVMMTLSVNDEDHNGRGRKKGIKTTAVTKEFTLDVRATKRLAFGAQVSDRTVKTADGNTGITTTRKIPYVGARVLFTVAKDKKKS